MALLGLSLIVASFVLFCIRRPTWFPSIFATPTRRLAASTPRAAPPEDGGQVAGPSGAGSTTNGDSGGGREAQTPARRQTPDEIPKSSLPRAIDPTTVGSDDGETTPKAAPAVLGTSVPTLAPSAAELRPESSIPNPGAHPAPSLPSSPVPAPATPSLMPPPPLPAAPRPPPPTSTSPSLAPPQNRHLPIPARGPGCSTLAPPPTHSSRPAKPSRQVVLSPGHSPLDWARLSGHPAADLRGLAAGTPYLRVTPSMLRRQTGRRGKDAWTALAGRVYNITPYVPFHPGGEAELLRAAGRDGTRLFGEIHPWVNYEGMLAACLVGIYVPEEQGAGQTAGKDGDMEAMD